MAGLLGPYTAGLFSTLMVIPQLTQYLTFGLIEALPLAIPRNRGRGQPEKERRIRTSVLCAVIAASGGAAVVTFSYAAVTAVSDGEAALFVAFAAVVAVMWQLNRFLLTQYAVEGWFVELSRIELGFAATVCCVQVLAVWWLNGYGYWIGLIGPYCAIVAYCGSGYMKRHRVTIPDEWLSEARELIPIGLAMLISSAPHTLFMIVSRIFMAATVGVREVGFFILATLVLSKISSVASAIARVMLPEMSLLYGKGGDSADLYSVFLKAQVYTLGVAVAIAATGVLLIESLTAWALPAYLPGVPAATVMMLTGIPYSAVINANGVLLSTERLRAHTVLFLCGLGIQGSVLGYLFVAGTTSAVTVALASAVAFSLYAAMANIAVVRVFREAGVGRASGAK